MPTQAMVPYPVHVAQSTEILHAIQRSDGHLLLACGVCRRCRSRESTRCRKPTPQYPPPLLHLPERQARVLSALL